MSRSSQPSVRRLESVPGPWWDELVCRSYSPWHSRGLALAHGEFHVDPIFLLAEAGDTPLGGVTIYLQGSARMPSLDRLFARTAFIPDEPAVVDRPDEVLPAILDAVEAELRRMQVVTATWRMELPRGLPAECLSARGWKVRPFGVAVLALPAQEEALDRGMHRMAQKQVRKAARLGVEVRVAPDVGPLLPLLHKSFERSGLPRRNDRYVRRVHELVGGEVLVASHAMRDMAALLWADFGPVGLNMFHGRQDGDLGGAPQLLHREMLRRAHRRGVRLMHTGGAALPGEADSGIAGITQFKRALGFEVRTAYEARRIFRPIGAALREASRWFWLRLRSPNRPEPPDARGGSAT
jgi:hypothetical protein